MIKIIKLTQQDKEYTALYVAVNALNVDFDNDDFKNVICYGSKREAVLKISKHFMPNEKLIHLAVNIDYMSSVITYLESYHDDKICCW